jgi:ADP-ribose pyrophosphatase YjhB (NUDIX family)
MAISFKNKPNEKVTVEGRDIYISRSVAVVALIVATVEDKRYILINKRGENAADYRGLYNLPCGYLDWNETGVDACVRETYEETGVDISSDINQDMQPYVSTKVSNNRQNVSLTYTINVDYETLPETTNANSELGEVAEILWIPIEEYVNYEFAFSHNKKIEYFINH